MVDVLRHAWFPNFTGGGGRIKNVAGRQNMVLSVTTATRAKVVPKWLTDLTMCCKSRASRLKCLQESPLAKMRHEASFGHVCLWSLKPYLLCSCKRRWPEITISRLAPGVTSRLPSLMESEDATPLHRSNATNTSQSSFSFQKPRYNTLSSEAHPPQLRNSTDYFSHCLSDSQNSEPAFPTTRSPVPVLPPSPCHQDQS